MSRGFVMFISVNDLFKDFVRDHYELVEGAELLIISRDITANGEVSDNDLPFGDNQYTSRYESISFVPDLVPNASVMESAHGTTKSEFCQAYMQQLDTKSSARYLCCIADTVVNDDSKIILVCSQTEYLLEYMEVLRDFMESRYKLNIYSYTDFQSDNNCIYSNNCKGNFCAGLDPNLGCQLRKLYFEFIYNIVIYYKENFNVDF